MNSKPGQSGTGDAAGSVRVDLAERSYDVLVGPALLSRVGGLARSRCRAGAARAFIVIDDNIPAAMVERAAAALEGAGFRTSRAAVRASESGKSLETVQKLLVSFAATRHERWDPVIALGGGIVGDVTGFAAGIYRRGVPFIQCPTTLLSMVDASVGGKTGANLEVDGALKKNLVGVFHQPIGVLADLDTLGSLPDRELRAGLAECVKHAMISADFGDPGLWRWTLDHAEALLARDPARLTELVVRNVGVKARVVAGDEREETEGGGRALLNLGHTFGHAIEPMAHLSPDGDPRHAPLLHGEAVALGLVAACATAESIGSSPPGLRGEVESLLARLGLPTRVAGLPADEVTLTAIAHDKKVMSGRLRLVLPRGIGRAEVVAAPPEAAVRTGLSAIRRA
ncbi:MAG: 3-dehydroquinate synthase [Phycisphaerales bacterium]|nr:3-dehydroquinate synthase [Phycisphaerales bacterium]